MPKRYYWLKLKDDFFDSKRIKKLRRLAGGDTFTIIYLKMQLKAMKSNGVLEFDGLEKTFAEEIALDIDEEPENVQLTLSYLISCGLVETSDESSYFLPYVVANTGSEGSSAQRMRDLRSRQPPPSLPEASHCDILVTERKRKRKEIDKEIEIDASGSAEPKKPIRHKYGQYENVLLTDEELEKLKSEFPDFQERIERLSEYMASTGKHYKSHLATIRNWARRDGVKSKGSGDRVLDSDEAEAIRRMMGIDV